MKQFTETVQKLKEKVTQKYNEYMDAVKALTEQQKKELDISNLKGKFVKIDGGGMVRWLFVKQLYSLCEGEEEQSFIFKGWGFRSKFGSNVRDMFVNIDGDSYIEIGLEHLKGGLFDIEEVSRKEFIGEFNTMMNAIKIDTNALFISDYFN